MSLYNRMEQERAIAFQAIVSSWRGVVITDADEMISYANTAFIAMFGFECEDELVGRAFDEIIAKLKFDPISDVIGRLPKEYWKLHECVCRLPDEKVSTIEITYSTVVDDDGNFLGRLVSFVDITERKLVESALHETQQRMRLAFDAGKMGSWEWDLRSGLITYDVAMTELYGLAPSVTTLDIEKAFEIVHPEDLPHLKGRIDEALQQRDYYQDEFRIRVDGEQPRWIGVRGEVRCDRYGDPISIIGVCFDISSGKRAQRDLVAKSELLNAIISTAVEAIITIDCKGIIQSFNRAGERMFGYTADEVIGLNVSILMPEPYSKEHDSYLDNYLRTGEAHVIGTLRDAVARRKDGSVFPIELVVSEIDHMRMFTGLIRDITHRKAMEESLARAERLNSIGTLAAGLGHDMNNILLPVRARLDLIEHADLPENIHEQVSEIRKYTKYLQDLADSLHLLVLDPDDADGSTHQTDLNSWWDQTHSLLARALPKAVEFSAAIPTNLPRIAIAPHRMTQAVLNLLVNSGKAVAETGGIVRIWAQADQDDQIVRVGVSDNGCGMTEEIQRRVLEPFFTTKTRGIGTGLGLSLVHRVVQSANGSIDISSKPGEGTEIILSIPSAVQPCNDDSGNYVSAIPRIAFVSVKDKRTESLVVSLLEMADVAVEIDTKSKACDCDECLWITDTSDVEIDVVRACLNRDCHVIFLGPVPDELREPNISVVENPDDFASLQSTVSRVAQGVFR